MRKGCIQTSCGILSAASVVGKKEKDGPLGSCFDLHSADDRFGQRTWEKAEAEMQRLALNTAMAKGEIDQYAIEAIFAGDLLNQCVGAAYGLKDFDVPYFGLYGACSTAAEGLLLSSLLVSGGLIKRAAAVASSHFCTAERQYRSPIEYGGQRAPTAQWTVTGAGAFIVGEGQGAAALVKGVCPGIVVEKGVRDSANMGAAMAPATADTLLRFFDTTGKKPRDFDLIVTGDLGYEGGDILCELMALEGVDIRDVYNDCGMMIYNREVQDTHAGGSGCGCSAAVLATYLLPKLECGELRRILFLGTGAMMSPQSIQQGESIPAVAHLLCITSKEEKEWTLC
ncbi:MAG: stage V sporulation protein AD [Clostridia bacterium]|nr:stage V sporulation protein AD [Clostridia bacterium]